MRINKIILQKALEIVKPGLATKELIEQATSFAFIKGRIVTYNDEISISHPVEGLEIEGAVKADKLYSLLSKIKTDEIEIEIKGNELILLSGRSKAGIPIQMDIKLPLDEAIGSIGKWKDLPENFIKHMFFTMSACARDASMPKFTCVNVSEEGFIEATDSFRIAHCKLRQGMPIKTFLIPSSSVANMVKMNPNKIAEGNGWVHFKTAEGTIMSCRIFEDAFPDTSSVLDITGDEIPLPKTISEVLDRAEVFARREHMLDEIVEITLQDRKFKIRAESDAGWFEEEVNLKYSGTEIAFMITPYLLKSILNEVSSCLFCNDKLKFQGEDWEYVVCLKNKTK